MKEMSDSIVLTGGLGNQLFQYAFLLNQPLTRKYLISEWGAPRLNKQMRPEIFSFSGISLDVNEYKPKHRARVLPKFLGYCLRSGFTPRKWEHPKFIKVIRLVTSILVTLDKRHISTIIAHPALGYSKTIRNSSRSQIHLGYYQSFEYSKRQEVKNILRELHLPLTPRMLELSNFSKQEKPIVLHFRFGDYLTEADFGIPGLDYYKKSLEYLSQRNTKGKYWVFSDDIKLANERLTQLGISDFRIFSNSEFSTAETFELMRMGHSYVIANSTFSWWAASLTRNPEGTVIAPDPWFQRMEEPLRLIPEDWVRISASF